MNVPQPAKAGVSSSVLSRDIFATQDSLLKLLVAIRGSAMPVDLKMVARDAVLEYSQQTDSDKKNQIADDVLELLTPYAKDIAGLSRGTSAPTRVAPQNETPSPGVSSNVGRTRPAPVFVFTPSQVSKESVDVPKAVDAITSPVVEKDSIEKTEVPTLTATPKDSEVAKVIEPAVVEDIKEVQETPAVTITGVVAKTLEDHSTRIKEIKRSVNERVGNPINLIDTNNEIGREYMNSLLEAMKKTTGDGEGADVAMQKLENTYQKVNQLLDNPSAVPQSSSAPRNDPASNEPLKQMVPPAKLDVKATVKAPVVETIKPVPSEVKLPNYAEVAKVAPAPESEPIVAPRPIAVPNDGKLHSVAAVSAGGPLTELMKEEDAKDLVGHSQGTPMTAGDILNKKDSQNKDQSILDRPIDINDPKVEAGLEQLLSEWKLFKSSGLFGTGPSGLEHPLYKTLEKLPMASVISGRFEGSDPAVKQSITDYMNGWRYEQGIVHEMNETFEHYLKRVIAHIIKRQVKKTTA